MDFSFSDEQSLLKDSVERFIQNDYAFDARQKLVKNEPGFSAKNWKTFADLGWLGVPFAEADGGFGGGPIETMLIMEQFGRGLVVEPFVPTVVLVGGMLRLAGNRAQKEKYLARHRRWISARRVRFRRTARALQPRGSDDHRCRRPATVTC